MTDSVQFIPESNIKIYPALARAALAVGLARQCRWWHILRGVVARQGGWQYFTRDQVIAIFDAHGVDRRQAYHLFEDGGIFFEVNHRRGVVALVGLQRVSEALGCDTGRPVLLPVEQVSGKVSKWKAAVYALAFERKPRNISRRRLQEETGVSGSTQRRYERAAGVKVERQFAYAKEGEEVKIPDGAPWWWETIDGAPVMVWQVVNRLILHRDTRKIHPTHCRRGMSRKIKRTSPKNGDGVHGRRRSIFDKEPRRLPAGSSLVRNPGAGLFGYINRSGRMQSGGLFEMVKA